MPSMISEQLQKGAVVSPIQEWLSRPQERQTMRNTGGGHNSGAKVVGTDSKMSRLEEVSQQRVAMSASHRTELADWLNRFAAYGVGIDDYNNRVMALVNGSAGRTLHDFSIEQRPKFPQMRGPPKPYGARTQA
jgi:hypothetical protein